MYFQLILFLKGYHESDQRKLAIITGVFLATGFCSAKVLSNLFEDHLVKDGKILFLQTGNQFSSRQRFLLFELLIKLYMN